MRALETAAVRAHQEHVVAACHGAQFGRLLSRDAGGDDQRRLAADAPCHFQCRHHLVRGQCHQRQVGTGIDQVCQAALGGVHVQEVELAGVALGREGLVEVLRIPVGRIGFAQLGVAGKHRDRGRSKQGREVVLVHIVSLSVEGTQKPRAAAQRGGVLHDQL